MKTRAINSQDSPATSGFYSQAVEISDATRTLYISGQIPVGRDGTTPESFTDQARLAWANVEAQLHAADMSLENIVKHTTYLSDRRYRDENASVRQKILGTLEPALTVVITGIYDEEWLLEIEAVAVA